MDFKGAARSVHPHKATDVNGVMAKGYGVILGDGDV